MRRFVFAALIALAMMALVVPAAFAGSPHFVEVSATRDGNSLTVSGKEAGLGDEEQVNILVEATALCINGGGHHPKAVNKASVSSSKDVPVQNGKAIFDLTVEATFQPDCTPPMTVVFTDVKVTDTTNNISKNLTGTF